MSRWPTGLLIALVGVVYLLSVKVGLVLTPMSQTTALVWPAGGIAITAVLLFGSRVWPGIALGALLAHLVVGGAPLAVALSIAAANVIEPVVAASLLERLGFDRSLGRTRDVLALIVVAALASTISASGAVSGLWFGGLISSQRAVFVWRAWWMAEALGYLSIAPALLTWFTHRDKPSRQRILEGVLVLVTVFSLSSLSFCVRPPALDPFRQAYVVFPALIWAAIRFEQRGATLATLLTCLIATLGTVRDRGPFVNPTLDVALMTLQAFTAVMSSTALILSVAIAEQRRNMRIIRDQDAEKMRLLRRAEDAVRARDEFLSIASHELRTPLSSLVLQLEAAQDLLRSPADPNKIAVKVEKAVRATARLRALVDRLLDVSRIMAGRPNLVCEQFDLVELVREVIDGNAEEARNASVTILVRAPPSLAGQWDRTRIEQVLVNLISNAIKYGREKPVDVIVTGDEDRAKVEVIDRGIGIDAADIERIFVRFERAVPATRYGGLGLGLYVTRQIAEAHGGRVTVTSAPGQGATFTLDLPRWRI